MQNAYVVKLAIYGAILLGSTP